MEETTDESPTITPETPDQEEVRLLFRLSDAYSAARYPPESNHMVYGDSLTASNARFFVARLGGRAVGCGALIVGPAGEAEIKRMFVHPEVQGRGIGRAVLAALEATARRENLRVLHLETGVRNDEALALYRRSGYRERGPFGAYRPDPLSVFMEKAIVRSSGGA